jgi:hypothetical protein
MRLLLKAATSVAAMIPIRVGIAAIRIVAPAFG